MSPTTILILTREELETLIAALSLYDADDTPLLACLELHLERME